MALNAFRLRRAICLSSSLLHRHSRPFYSIALDSQTPPVLRRTESQHFHTPFQSRFFRSSTVSLSSRSRPYNSQDLEGEITPDTILFEGCDYNHWLITMEFPKDPKPTPEEMVETYVQTAAKVLGSVEDAKKKIYACSTTTYTGFQVEVSEEVSEKFKGLPGVVFVLPDSYIDPVNKEYGGDKYINGTIIPRPPPVVYGRQQGRLSNRNRQPRPQTQYSQGNPPYDNQAAPQNYVQQQNYSPPRMGERRDGMPMNNAPQQPTNFQPGYLRDNRNYTPSEDGGYGHGAGGGYGQGQGASGDYGQGQGAAGGYRQGQGAAGGYGQQAGGGYGQQTDGGYGQQTGGGYGQQTGGGYGQQTDGGYGQQTGGGYGQRAGVGYGQRAGVGYGQQAGVGYGQQVGGSYGNGLGGGQGQGLGLGYNQNYPRRDFAPSEQRGFKEDNQSYAPPQPGGYRQGAGHTYGQGAGGGQGQGIASNYGRQYPQNGEDERFPQVEQKNNMMTEEQRNYSAMGATDQGIHRD